MNKGCILIPTYNEVENIKNLILKIRQYLTDIQIYVIDDNSPDGTANIVRKIEETDINVRLIFRPKKNGLGAAYIHGMTVAAEKEFDFVIMMDSDFSHNPKHLPTMIENIQKYDVVIGSRYVKGGGIKNWPMYRKLMSFAANYMIKIFLKANVKDSTTGYRCIKTNILKKIKFETIHSQGYSFLYEMLWRIEGVGARIKEIPIIFIDRQFGQTKISQGEILKAMTMLVRLNFSRKF
ncbi:polyprenol monophosphomannose synthase [bacterium]|nr:polyprenol monophosphomannose synthase [bacterium]